MFDLKKLHHNRNQARKHIITSPFHQFLYQDIIDRLDPINKISSNVLILDASIPGIFDDFLFTKFPSTNITHSSFDKLETTANKFDLIIFPFTMHWVNNVQKFLADVKNHLHKGGIFICNFSAGGSLSNIRKKLVELETLHSLGHRPHISPFIQFDQVTALLQQAGFVENIIDMESIEFEYSTPLAWIRAIRQAGESNILNNSVAYSITKKLYSSLKLGVEGAFKDNVNLVTCISSPKKGSLKLHDEYFQQNKSN